MTDKKSFKQIWLEKLRDQKFDSYGILALIKEANREWLTQNLQPIERWQTSDRNCVIKELLEELKS